MRQPLVLFMVLCGLTDLAPSSARAAAIWDQWFTTTQGGEIVGYTREIFEERGDDYVYRVEDWKRGTSEKKFSKSVVSARARGRAALDPISFKREEDHLTVEGLRADGRVAKGKRPYLKISVRETDHAEVRSERALPLKSVLSPFLPVWLGEMAPKAQVGRKLSVLLVSTSPLDAKSLAVQARFLERDDFGKKNRVGKVEVLRNSDKETWWIDGRGLPLRIERADQVIERADESNVRTFLEKS